MTSRTSVLILGEHPLVLDARACPAAGQGPSASSVRFIRTKREAFQSLLAKLRLAMHLLVARSAYRCLGVLPVARVKRSASAPYWSMISSGSMPLPRDLLIFLPCASRTRPWIQNGVERHLAGVLQSREDHAGHPEEDDVVAGNQSVGRDRSIPAPGFYPASPGSRTATAPRRTRCPACPRPGAGGCCRTSGRSVGRFLGDDHLAAVVAVPGRDTVAPPELTGDAPVLDVLHPVKIDLVQSARGSNLISPLRTTSMAGFASGSILTNHCLETIGSTVVPQR